MMTIKKTGHIGMAKFQQDNCQGCYFADKPKVGTGEPCCTYGFKLFTDKGIKCLGRKTKP